MSDQSPHTLKDGGKPCDIVETAFLKLPGEIRNRIYDLALSSKIIHVWSNKFENEILYGKSAGNEMGDGMKFRVDRRDILDYTPFLGMVGALHDPSNKVTLEQMPQGATEKAPDADDGFPPLPTGLNDDSFSPDHLPVQLLRVSRQIYNEAAKIPYANNLFVFHADIPDGFNHTLESFALRIPMEQRRAIRSIAIDRVSNAILAQLDLRSVLPEVQHLLLDIQIWCNWASRRAGPRNRTT